MRAVGSLRVSRPGADERDRRSDLGTPMSGAHCGELTPFPQRGSCRWGSGPAPRDGARCFCSSTHSKPRTAGPPLHGGTLRWCQRCHNRSCCEEKRAHQKYLLTTHLQGTPAPRPPRPDRVFNFIASHCRLMCLFVPSGAPTTLSDPGEQGICSHPSAHVISSPQPRAWHVTAVQRVFVDEWRRGGKLCCVSAAGQVPGVWLGTGTHSTSPWGHVCRCPCTVGSGVCTRGFTAARPRAVRGELVGFSVESGSRP